MLRLLVLLVGCIPLAALSAQAKDAASFDNTIKPFLTDHCLDCHNGDTQEGDVALHDLNGVTVENAELWKRVWEQVSLGEMPPEDSGDTPDPMRRLELSDWITSQLQVAMENRGGFETHHLPAKGNHLDHDLLFGEIPEGLVPTSSPARLWRIHPQEHLVRLSALINREPAFDPNRPGLRARGDHIQPNQDGETKVYYGLDRVIGWVGGTAAYAAAITGFPPILTTDDHHGLRNYPILYSVNGAEATQIASHAEDILRFMAFGPDAEPYQYADKVSEIDQKYKHGDLRGLAQSLFYAKEIKRPLTPVYDLMNEPGVSDERLKAAVEFLFESLTCRPPTESETADYIAVAKEAIDDLGKEDGVILGLTPIFLDRDALFRAELVETGAADAHGRVMLQDQELALAINAALSYLPPDSQLKQAAASGQLRTREDVRREVARILEDDSIRKPRLLQFFREYFDYDRAGANCKDNQALLAAGGMPNPQNHYRAMFAMTASTDRLVELILHEDRQVLRQLLTTDRVVADPNNDAAYLGQYISSDKPEPDPNPKKRRNQRRVTIEPAELPGGESIHVRIARVVKRGKTQRRLTTLPREQRRGILTHPSWLVSHSDAMDNHAILRGKWVRERLLGGAVPDVPITVDAMLPDEPKQTLRHRMRVTRESECWRCHQKMDPLGLPFEMYNHLGLYRTIELKEPVDTSGEVIGSGDKDLDGPVDNAIEMIDRLAESKRVEQVFVRHVFRFWMGRNETIHDAPVLQAAWHAYRDNNGSMKALLTSLLTSDAFLYRTRDGEGSAKTTGAVKASDQWANHRGPNQDYTVTSPRSYPTSWSVSTNKNVLWRRPLPETGQSGIAVWGDKLFLTCFRELTEADNDKRGTWAAETRGFCLSAHTGDILWSCELPGKRPNQVNGVFNDSTTPTPVTDGQHVWFVNAGGFMACYTVHGELVWERSFEVRTKHSAKQFQPFLHDGKLFYAALRDESDPLRRPQTAKDYDKNSKAGWPWMFVRSFDALTGDPSGVMAGGITVHSKGAIGQLDGDIVLLHAKGGSHFPPEKPYGLSLSRLNDSFDSVWDRPNLFVEGTHFIDNKHAYCFDRKSMHVLDVATGKTVKTINLSGAGTAITFDEATGKYNEPVDVSELKMSRLLTHRTNIGVGDYHFFLSGKPGFIGRVNLGSGEVNYLQVPLQVKIEHGEAVYAWNDFRSGDETGSGFAVEGDRRRLGHGFGHVSAATPIVVNDKIYFSTILGTVYVVDATAKDFGPDALLDVCDFGLPGQTWSLSPLAAANGRFYQRTSKEIICIGDDS